MEKILESENRPLQLTGELCAQGAASKFSRSLKENFYVAILCTRSVISRYLNPKLQYD